MLLYFLITLLPSFLGSRDQITQAQIASDFSTFSYTEFPLPTPDTLLITSYTGRFLSGLQKRKKAAKIPKGNEPVEERQKLSIRFSKVATWAQLLQIGPGESCGVENVENFKRQGKWIWKRLVSLRECFSAEVFSCAGGGLMHKSLSTANCVQFSISGHGKPYLAIRAAQP